MPLKLISVTETDDEQDKFEVHQEGIDFLNHLPNNVAVISSCGRIKSGKTTLLNYILCKIKNDGVSK